MSVTLKDIARRAEVDPTVVLRRPAQQPAGPVFPENEGEDTCSGEGDGVLPQLRGQRLAERQDPSDRRRHAIAFPS